NEVSVRRRALHRVQRLRDRLQAGERGALGREPPPGGHHQRRGGGRREVDLGGLHALLGRAVHGGVPGGLLLQDRRRGGAARQGAVHRLRVLLLRLPVRGAAVSAGGGVRAAGQDGQVHVLRGRSGAGPLGGGVPQVRAQPPGRREAPGVRGDVLDQGA